LFGYLRRTYNLFLLLYTLFEYLRRTYNLFCCFVIGVFVTPIFTLAPRPFPESDIPFYLQDPHGYFVQGHTQDIAFDLDIDEELAFSLLHVDALSPAALVEFQEAKLEHTRQQQHLFLQDGFNLDTDRGTDRDRLAAHVHTVCGEDIFYHPANETIAFALQHPSSTRVFVPVPNV
jgi:hypothetical protein